MTSSATIHKDVNAAFKQASASQLSAAGKKAWTAAINMTVIDFAKAAAKLPTPDDVWKNAAFKKFILQVAADIGTEASKNTKKGDISATTVNAAARKLMLAWSARCKTAIKNGRVYFPHVREGILCTGFLNTKLK